MLSAEISDLSPNLDQIGHGDTYHNDVNEGDRIERDVPQIHESQEAVDDESYGEHGHQGGPQIEAHEYEGDHEHCTHAGYKVPERVLDNRQVLLVEHVGFTGGRNKSFPMKTRWCILYYRRPPPM